MTMDAEYRRVILEEIAYQRTVRDTAVRKELDQTIGPLGAANARHRADTARYTLRALYDVLDALRAVERQRALAQLDGYRPGDEW